MPSVCGSSLGEDAQRWVLAKIFDGLLPRFNLIDNLVSLLFSCSSRYEDASKILAQQAKYGYLPESFLRSEGRCVMDDENHDIKPRGVVANECGHIVWCWLIFVVRPQKRLVVVVILVNFACGHSTYYGYEPASHLVNELYDWLPATCEWFSILEAVSNSDDSTRHISLRWIFT